MTDTEKVSFNMSVVDLGKVDLLVKQGHYSNRTDFFITSVRNLLITHAPAVQEAVTRQFMMVGVTTYNREMLERMRTKRQQLDARVVGVVVISKDVTPELARATIKSLQVYGTLRASPTVKEALKDRML